MDSLDDRNDEPSYTLQSLAPSLGPECSTTGTSVWKRWSLCRCSHRSMFGEVCTNLDIIYIYMYIQYIHIYVYIIMYIYIRSDICLRLSTYTAYTLGHVRNHRPSGRWVKAVAHRTHRWDASNGDRFASRLPGPREATAETGSKSEKCWHKMGISREKVACWPSKTSISINPLGLSVEDGSHRL